MIEPYRNAEARQGRLSDTQNKLTQVSTATESATMEMLNGLERTLALLDALEAGGHREQAETLATLREEVNQLFGHLQFQDIIAQQLLGVMDLLTDLENRIGHVAGLLDHSIVPPVDARPKDAGSYNPEARWDVAATHQAEIDRNFPRG